MNSNALIYIALFLAIVAISMIYLSNGRIREVIKADTITSERIDTFWKIDTFKMQKLVPKYIIKSKVDTVYDHEHNPIELITENKVYQDTIICKKDTAELQIFTSGIRSNVDSINLNLRKSEIVKTNTIEIIKYVEKPKTIWNKIHVQPQATSGYDIINHQWGVTFGVGVGIDF